MAVVIRPIGGLGNQLFVYAAGKALSRRQDIPLRIDRSHFKKYPLRLFELDSFESHFEELQTGNQFSSRLTKYLFTGGSRISRLVKKIAHGPGRLFEQDFVFEPRLLKVRRHVGLEGYFQSWRYFGEIADELRQEIRSISSPSNFYTNLQKELAGAGVSVAIHVRRGDYISNSYMGLVPEAYYRHALGLLQELVGDFQIYLFSDDLELLHDDSFLAAWRKRVRIVMAPDDSRPVESLNLIAQCDHVVMANSTFSWWGAWLGERAGRHVFYPRPWLAGALVDDRDLALPTWICLGSE